MFWIVLLAAVILASAPIEQTQASAVPGLIAKHGGHQPDWYLDFAAWLSHVMADSKSGSMGSLLGGGNRRRRRRSAPEDYPMAPEEGEVKLTPIEDQLDFMHDMVETIFASEIIEDEDIEDEDYEEETETIPIPVLPVPPYDDDDHQDPYTDDDDYVEPKPKPKPYKKKKSKKQPSKKYRKKKPSYDYDDDDDYDEYDDYDVEPFFGKTSKHFKLNPYYFYSRFPKYHSPYYRYRRYYPRRRFYRPYH